MAQFKLKIEGLKEAQKMLEQLPKDISDRVLYDVNKAAAKTVKKELEAAAANVSGDDNKASKNKIENNVIIAKGETKTSVLIGFAKRAFQVLFVEKGTKVRKTEKGANRGTMTRKPFVADAHERAAPKAIQYVTDNFLKIVGRSLKRQAKRFNKK